MALLSERVFEGPLLGTYERVMDRNPKLGAGHVLYEGFLRVETAPARSYQYMFYTLYLVLLYM